MITEAKYEAAVREVRTKLRQKTTVEIRKTSEKHWSPAATVTKRSLRILLAAAKKAESP